MTDGLLAPPSEELVADAEDLERQKLELQKLGVRREIEEQMSYFRAQEHEEEDREEQRRNRLQEQRRQQQREQVQLQERRRRQRWQSQWLQFALRSMPYDAPEEMKLPVHKQVTETLARLNLTESRRVIRQLVEAATEKALKPWRRQQEIKNVIDDALPFSIKYSDEKPKALRAAAEAISKLRPQATREELQLAAKEAIQPFIVKHEHEKQCEQIIRSVPFHLRSETAHDRDVGRNAVRAEMAKLPVGCGVKMMEQTRDRFLDYLQQVIDRRSEEAAVQRKKQEAEAQAEEAKRKKQQREARRKQEADEALRQAESRLLWRLGHVDDHLRQLDESEIEFESLSERWGLAEKFKKAIRPILIKELLKKPGLTDDRIHERIERMVDEQLKEELEVEEAV